jgi:hypothetical protein
MTFEKTPRRKEEKYERKYILYSFKYLNTR